MSGTARLVYSARAMTQPFVVLDFPTSAARPEPGSLLFADPIAVLEAFDIGAVAQTFAAAERHAAMGHHVAGFVAYEAAPAFDGALATRPPNDALPLVWFGVFSKPRRGPSAVLDHDIGGSPTATWSERTSQEAFGRAVSAIRDAIGRGDVYQVNHTIRLDVDVRGSVDHLYRRLNAAQGGGYSALIHTGRFDIVSASPELFFDRSGDQLVARPMKGTARRGRWLAEDDARAATLAASEKERAENVMIVDLVRNDIGRIAQPGTVHVPQLFSVERLPTVLQMTSTVTARLRPGISIWNIFAALFPCGSVTGAPKIAATRFIATLEHDPRGVYCGAVGHIAPGGEATFSVAIRTLTVHRESGRAEYGVGSGITWDSAAAAEYDEVLAKAAILTADLPTFDLLETLRLVEGEYARLGRHLARLEQSAAYFGFASPVGIRDAAARALEVHAASAPPGARQRVRVKISPNGIATVDSEALPMTLAQPVPIAVASSPVKRANRFLYHKTTHRAVYDRHRAEHAEAFDVLLWNEREELTEFTIGNLVAEIDGDRWTPPRDCGLLAGAFREELLERGLVRERVVRVTELERATGLWLVNSVREWVPVKRETGRGASGMFLTRC